MKILPRIKFEDNSFGSGYSGKTKGIQKYFRNEFELIKQERETVKYYKDLLIKNYIYKGPLLEWYLRIKLRFEGYYEIYDRIVPKEGKIIDIGCGYGFNIYMLGFTSKNRILTGIDYDQEKIEIANNCNAKTENINFICEDITNCNFSLSDVFILSDVLHYIKKENQNELIIKCIENLNEDGMLIIRDGDSEMKNRHVFTKMSEFFSTKFGFNKVTNKLCFISRSEIEKIAQEYNCSLKVIDRSILTSNVFYVMRKNKSIKHGKI
jgi:2-polyprenyl-3-methyl-5-hydroxy-6-metoxy-1,4-benzoquinol methylase